MILVLLSVFGHTMNKTMTGGKVLETFETRTELMQNMIDVNYYLAFYLALEKVILDGDINRRGLITNRRIRTSGNRCLRYIDNVISTIGIGNKNGIIETQTKFMVPRKENTERKK